MHAHTFIMIQFLIINIQQQSSHNCIKANLILTVVRSYLLTSKPANCQLCALPCCWGLCARVTGVAFSRSHVADASNRPDVAWSALMQSDSLKPSSWRRFTDIAIVMNNKNTHIMQFNFYSLQIRKITRRLHKNGGLRVMLSLVNQFIPDTELTKLSL